MVLKAKGALIYSDQQKKNREEKFTKIRIENL